uniref:Zinc ribbon domain-containing protein n=1 Tax=candidate division CPR3 bacterium TaxID=2268181 RepID=A0A7C4M0Y2_UNCC3
MTISFLVFFIVVFLVFIFLIKNRDRIDQGFENLLKVWGKGSITEKELSERITTNILEKISVENITQKITGNIEGILTNNDNWNHLVAKVDAIAEELLALKNQEHSCNCSQKSPIDFDIIEEELITCTHCGKKSSSELAFCPFCGERIEQYPDLN